MECDSKMDWRTTLRISVRAALALIVLCLLVIPVAIQADLKATAVVYSWDFVAIKFQNSNVIIPWDGAWLPFLPESVWDQFTVMPIQIYNWITLPQHEYRFGLAAAAILVLLVILLAMNGLAVYLRNRFEIKW